MELPCIIIPENFMDASFLTKDAGKLKLAIVLVYEFGVGGAEIFDLLTAAVTSKNETIFAFCVID